MNDFMPPPILPTNVEAEQQVLGAILCRNQAWDDIADILKPEMFADDRHGRIFEACSKLISRGQVASATTLKNYLEQDTTLAQIGGAIYLNQLVAAAIGIGTIDHAKLIANLWKLRGLIQFGDDVRLKAMALDLDASADDQIGEAEAALLALAQTGELGRGLVTAGTAAENALKAADEAARRETKLSGLATDFYRLDQMTGGLEPGSVYVVGARPSMGKTSIALWIAWSVARRNKPVAFFSLEMSAEQLSRRLLAGLCDIDLNRIKTGDLSENEWHRLTEARHSLDKLPLFIDDASGLTAAQVRNRARRLKLKSGLAMIVVDHLIIMGKDPGLHSRANTVEIVGRNSGLIKQAAKELQVPIVLLCQLSRANEQREDKRPQLSDLRWAGEIEQDADLVAFIHREHYYKQRAKPTRKDGEKPETFAQRFNDWEDECRELENKAELLIAKQRDGAVGTIDLEFHEPTARFSNPER